MKQMHFFVTLVSAEGLQRLTVSEEATATTEQATENETESLL